jgi:hypothetical protein
VALDLALGITSRALQINSAGKTIEGSVESSQTIGIGFGIGVAIEERMMV